MDQDIKVRYFNKFTVRLEGKFIVRVGYRIYALQCRALTSDTFPVCAQLSYTWKIIHMKQACKFKECLYPSI